MDLPPAPADAMMRRELQTQALARRRPEVAMVEVNVPVLVGALVGIGVALLVIRLASAERRLNGLPRLEAKVDALLKQAGIEFDPYRDVPPDVREALERGQTIRAIKRFRQATGVGLKEAKEFVDEVRRRRLTGRRTA